jgi:hypothetical protein
MDKPTPYLETSVISYLAALPSRDPVTARNQQITREWWDARRMDYELRTSEFVTEEAEQGDLVYARRRLALLEGIRVVAAEPPAGRLASELLRSVPLPEKAAHDAAHIAIAAVGGMEYLLTWNCKHIANPRLQTRIRQVVRKAGFVEPVLCTPAELMARQ